MVTRIGGKRRKTRAMFTKPKRERGKLKLRNYLQAFKTGDKVALKAEPAVQSGMYFRRYHGKIATVKEKLGTCYAVLVTDGGKKKELIVHPVHLKKVS